MLESGLQPRTCDSQVQCISNQETLQQPRHNAFKPSHSIYQGQGRWQPPMMWSLEVNTKGDELKAKHVKIPTISQSIPSSSLKKSSVFLVDTLLKGSASMCQLKELSKSYFTVLCWHNTCLGNLVHSLREVAGSIVSTKSRVQFLHSKYKLSLKD